ncbi:diguanylate cyclase [Demequina sp.]|uniref:histidine kinase N-terminal 7TM domain-containing diguanylate cyclase n=1 Tax=Demequina sp. TaxID=2050685 RepID=UPI0025BC1053|nr:diguanylate cyclase [Demequina sp.]
MTLLLSIAHIATILVAIWVGVTVLRGNRLTLAGLAVATVLVATVMWSVISLVALKYPFTATSEHPVRVLFWGALFVGGVRSLVKVLENPTWSPRPLDVINLVAHPAVVGLIAAVPALHPVMVVADDDGTLSYAVGFWIHTAVLLGLSAKLLASVFDRHRHLARSSKKTRIAVFLAGALPSVGYVVSVFVWGPSGPSLAPVLLVMPVAMIGSAVVRDGLVDKVPLARGELFESLAGAVFVTDNWGRVIDANAAARDFALEIDGAKDFLGESLGRSCPRTAHILESEGDVDVPGLAEPRVVSVVTTLIRDGRGGTVGRCVILQDVTESVMQRRELERTRDALSREVEVSEELRAELGDQVIRDSATGLYNRRFLAEALPEIVQSCIAMGSPLSVVVVDIDDFKSVNDSLGHVVGDRVIEAVAEVLKRGAPGGHAVRYGGDEYLVLLPGSTAEQAHAVAEAMRDACAELRVETRDGPAQVTVSAGVATLIGEDIETGELLEVADLALYRAKQAGRNRTWSQADGGA